MTFKKNQRVVGDTDVRYRVESGPWHACGVEYYLAQALNGFRAGDYALIAGTHLHRTPPQQGDKGHVKTRGGPMGNHPAGPFVIKYMDDQVILTQDRLGDYETWEKGQRQHLLNDWESVDD